MKLFFKNLFLIIFTIITTELFLSFYSCEKNGDKKEISNESDQDSGEKFPIDKNKTFMHPGLLNTQNDFERIKNKIEVHAEPWISGWNKLIANCHSSATYIMQGPTKKLIRGGNSIEEPDPDNYSRAMNDVAAAYQNAICWKISGNEAHAQKAIAILNAWASVCDTITGDSNKALGAGIYGYQFANAAEIMRDYKGWSDNDFVAFQQWMLKVFYPVGKAFLETHWNTCITHYWANWDLCNLASLISIGVLTDRTDIYNFAIDYLINGAGNGQLKKAIYYIHPDGLGQLQESGRDQGHVLLCVGLLGEICEMAWSQDDNLYGYDDNRVLRGAEYAACYNYNLGNVSFHPYNNCDNVNHMTISDNGRGGIRPIWEIIYNHYVKKAKIPAPYVTIAAKMHRPEGGGGDYGTTSGGFDSLGFGTLLYSLE